MFYQAIDIIIPHVRSVCLAKGGEKALREMSLSIVSTFVDASADMAAHRFKTFLARLVKCLGERDYLWILTLLLLKGSLNGYRILCVIQKIFVNRATLGQVETARK